MEQYNDKIVDLLTQRQILVERLKTSYTNEMIKIYKDILKDINLQLNKFEELNVANATKIISASKKLIDYGTPLVDELQELAINEVAYLQTAFNTAATVTAFKTVPTDTLLKRFANSDVFMGLTMKQTFDQLDYNTKLGIQTQIQLGLQQGDTIYQLKQRIKQFFGGTVTNDVTRIVRTATHTVVSRARMDFYEENSDIIKGYQHNSTLDLRTSSTCAVRDGLRWSIDKKPFGHKQAFRTPPLHPSCRSIITPITKSWEDIGIDGETLTPATRASMNGSVPQEVKFNSWIASKTAEQQEEWFGAGKYALYKKGLITLSDLVTNKGNPLTLAELTAKYQ